MADRFDEKQSLPAPLERGLYTLGAGAAVGFALALLELGFLRTRYATADERRALYLGLPALLITAGGVGGMLVAVLDGLCLGRMGHGGRFGLKRHGLQMMVLGVATAPWWGTIGSRLGRSALLARRFPWFGSRLGLCLALLATGLGTLLLFRMMLGLGERIRGGVVKGRGPRVLIALWAVLLGAGAFALDARIWHRLYPEFHAALLGISTMLLVIAWMVLVPYRQGPSPSHRAWHRGMRIGMGVGLGIMLCLGILASLTLHVSENVWFIAQDQTTAAQQVLDLAQRVARLWRPAPTAPRAAPRRVPVRRPFGIASGAALPLVPDAHVVLITVDALRPDHLGAYGYRRRVGREPLTPNLDRLAERSVLFERVYAQAPHTAYSVASLLGSEYVYSRVHLGQPLPPTLAEVLGARGFHSEAYFPSGLFFDGEQLLRPFVESNFGFRRVTTHITDGRELTDAVIEQLHTLRQAGEQRMALWVHYFDVHEPYHRHPEWDLGDGLMERYDSEIAYFDRQLGRLLGALGELDRPVVLALTADHGEEFKEHGGWYHGSSLYEEQVRVPLLVAAPGLAPRRVHEAVELVDVAPTLLGLVGEPIPPAWRGDDLGATLVGRAQPQRPAYSEMDGIRMVMAGGWKLIHDVRRDIHELYALSSDPRELVNRYDAAPKQAELLESELGGWIAALAEPTPESDPPPVQRAYLGDRSVGPELMALVQDVKAPVATRVAAVRALGQLEMKSARAVLGQQLKQPIWRLRAEAALALAALAAAEAGPVLLELLDDPPYRRRAGLMLGRLRDGRATPALIEAIEDPDFELRKQAIHFLGHVGDGRAIAPLIASAEELRTRYLVALALGRLGKKTGDARVLPVLLGRLGQETYEDNRSHWVAALGFLGDRGALSAVREQALLDPPVKWAGETLVRLGALAEGVAYGVDFAPEMSGQAVVGVSDCRRRPLRHGGESIDDYAGPTTCQAVGKRLEVRVVLEEARDTRLLLRISPRRIPADKTRVVLRINGKALRQIALEPRWQELPVAVPERMWRVGENRIELLPLGGVAGEGAWAEVDHLLVIPR